MDEKENQERCPKCGHGQIQSETCSKCGLLFMIYYEVQAREKRLSQEQPVLHITRRVGALGWASAICGIMAIFFIGISLEGTNILASEKKSSHEITQVNSYLQNGKKYFKEGETLNWRMDFAGAAEKFEEALKNFEEYDDKRLIAATKLNLAICYRILLKNEDSLDHFEEALDISRENGFKIYEAKAFQGSGLLYSHLGQYEMALIYLEEALSIHEDIGDKRSAALDCIIMGTIIEDNLNPAEAGTYFRRALSISEEIVDPMLKERAGRLLSNWSHRVTEKIPLSS